MSLKRCRSPTPKKHRVQNVCGAHGTGSVCPLVKVALLITVVWWWLWKRANWKYYADPCVLILTLLLCFQDVFNWIMFYFILFQIVGWLWFLVRTVILTILPGTAAKGRLIREAMVWASVPEGPKIFRGPKNNEQLTQVNIVRFSVLLLKCCYCVNLQIFLVIFLSVTWHSLGKQVPEDEMNL